MVLKFLWHIGSFDGTQTNTDPLIQSFLTARNMEITTVTLTNVEIVERMDLYV